MTLELGVLLFFAGLIFGSFATVLCYRIPRDIPIGVVSHTRSQCPHCGKVIAWYRNVPVLSYLIQKGRCAECGAPISRKYPLIEILTALGFVATGFVYFQSKDLPLDNFPRYAELVKLLYFTLSLVVVIFIDIEFRIIPDRFSIGNAVVALAASLIWGAPPLLYSVAGAVFGFGSFFLMAWGYEKFKGQEGLGFGDVKMMAWIGAWVGIFGVPFVILSASITGLGVGLIAMRRSKEGFQTAIPFGPFLAVGAYAAWVLQTLGYL